MLLWNHTNVLWNGPPYRNCSRRYAQSNPQSNSQSNPPTAVIAQTNLSFNFSNSWLPYTYPYSNVYFAYFSHYRRIKCSLPKCRYVVMWFSRIMPLSYKICTSTKTVPSYLAISIAKTPLTLSQCLFLHNYIIMPMSSKICIMLSLSLWLNIYR